MKILTVIGARPQIIKSAAISRAVNRSYKNKIQEIILHTGQHYDDNMSEVFFRELGIPFPGYHLGIGSFSHGKQTALMMQGIEEVIGKEKPKAVILYGDTNSTLAGAVAASKMQVPVVHIEAGLRSFNKSMPEEINRIVCDHVSTLLFSPTETGIKNLVHEGFRTDNKAPYSMDNPGIYHSGDVMYDNSLHFAAVAEPLFEKFSEQGIEKNNYALVTIHRNNNTDDPKRLSAIFSALHQIASQYCELVLPLHPRTGNLLKQNTGEKLYNEIISNKKLHILPPVSFLEMTALEKNAKLVMTDSGGVQKEAFYFGKPCIILRPETEWVELLEMNAALLADADEKKITDGFLRLQSADLSSCPKVYGDGKAAEFICGEMLKHLC